MKTNFTVEQLNKITELSNQGLGSRKIAEIIGANRSTIIRAYKQLGLESTSKKPLRTAYKATEKTCKICNETKLIEFFRQRIKGDRISYEPYCLDCEEKINKERCTIYYENNKEKFKQYREDNIEKITEYNKMYSLLNKDLLKEKRKLTREKDNERLKIYNKNKRKNNSEFRIRTYFSNAVRRILKMNGGSKNGQSYLQYLSYSIQELKKHLEKQFEPWMNWNNYGLYRSKSWNNDDQSTWTWQIDHIIPQSCLPYKSMEEDNFKKCWALENLRPLSSKQNNLDGSTKIRHKTIL